MVPIIDRFLVLQWNFFGKLSIVVRKKVFLQKRKEKVYVMNLFVYKKLENWSVYESFCALHALQEKVQALVYVNLCCVHNKTLAYKNVIIMSLNLKNVVVSYTCESLSNFRKNGDVRVILTKKYF